MNKFMDALKGIIIAIPSSLLVAIVFAYLFRIPIPMGGYIGPFGEFSTYDSSIVDILKSVFIALGFYGMFGGFIILTACGVITGIYTGHKYSEASNKTRMIVFWTALISAVPVFILSILDYIVGPWQKGVTTRSRVTTTFPWPLR